MRDQRGQTATEYMGMILVTAAIVLALASPRVTEPIRDAFRGQSDAVATERAAEQPDKEDRKRGGEDEDDRGKDRVVRRPTPAATPRPTGNRTLDLSRRLNQAQERLRTTKARPRTPEHDRLVAERNQIRAEYDRVRRDERRRERQG